MADNVFHLLHSSNASNRISETGSNLEPEDTLPTFEGERVHLHRYKLAGANNLPGEHVAATIDDKVTLTIEGVVVRVDHIVDRRTGRVKRLETIDVERIVSIGIASGRTEWTYPEKED